MVINDLLDNLRGNLRTIMVMMMIVMIILGNGMFAIKSILPRWREYEALTTQIDDYEIQLAQLEASSEGLKMSDVLQSQIDKAHTDLVEAAGVFLTDAQANNMLNLLFDYAASNGVEITNLQAQRAAEVAPGNEYDIRVFRLEVEGGLQLLLEFVAHIREASVPSVQIRSVNIQNSVLTTEIWFYVSSFASGDVLNNLPVAPPVPPMVVIESIPLAAVTETSIEPEPTPTAEALQVERTIVNPPATQLLPLTLLYSENFDAGVLYAWEADPAWTFDPEGDGQALTVESNSAPVIFRYSTLQDAAVQARFHTNGSARLSLRESQAGSYAAVINPERGEVQLYRRSLLIQTVALLAAPDGWYAVQLSSINDVVRLAVNEVEYIAIRDLAPLPPGTTSFALLSHGSLRVDDFMLWTLKHSAN